MTEYAAAEGAQNLLVTIENEADSVHFFIEHLKSTCQLNVGDEFGYLVDSKWRNLTPPLFKSSMGDVQVYYETGAERMYPSRERYAQFLEETEGEVKKCVESYDADNDSFELNPPETSTKLPWRATLLTDGMSGESNTTFIRYRPVREGYDNAGYLSDTVKIATNYRERYYE